ncbi:MAG TPA: DUF3570 domain-containing protein [Thermoanaerobaculia bacterium]|jgi:hypothetical protein|nr:DUF3570 domain-containing protein [Thermoanaerobaculia bacterium]
MQLEGSPGSSLRERLNKAALALLLVPAAAAAADQPTTQIDTTTLYYGEQNRVQVVEPVVRATRLFGDGQILSAQLAVDLITGSSPTGALPSGVPQSITSPSGKVSSTPAGAIPTTKFQDHRGGLDADWQTPIGKYFASTLGVHASREKDYQSLGVTGKVSAEMFQRTVTVTAGGGYNWDSVFPVGGTPIGLSDGSEVTNGKNSKRVETFLFGVSRVMSRRWLLGLDASRTLERGYLTEPYKVISLVSFRSESPIGQLTDNRPASRARSSLLASSVYHLDQDIIYSSYRYYKDSWGIRSNTVDASYRHDLDDGWYLEPHARYYHQTAADFFTFGIVAGLAPPEYATADYRLGQLTTMTLGLTFAFHVDDSPALWTVRADYIRQAGSGTAPDNLGAANTFDLNPAINTISLVVGYSFNL